jgi:hypothetical protein
MERFLQFHPGFGGVLTLKFGTQTLFWGVQKSKTQVGTVN